MKTGTSLELKSHEIPGEEGRGVVTIPPLVSDVGTRTLGI